MKPEIDRVFSEVSTWKTFPNPPQGGWLRAGRRAVGLSLKRLGKLSGRTPQAVRDAEQRELDGSISLGRLREIAAAMDMELVYGLVPRGGSVEELLKGRARERATLLLDKAQHHMRLENQLNDQYEQNEEVDALSELLLRENPAVLWT
ncbi:XRE family transcriptional regulator [Neolewinella sp.]|uniref:XRE family transcriptional regulator n=1 Tax=Neolewinella sp. TaxID=2993543 RepID=UPI003B51AAC4